MPLDASRCATCAATWLPARERCPSCGGAVARALAPEDGEILTWTLVHVAAAGAPAGGPVALVALGDAVALASAEPGAPASVGARVRVRASGGRLTYR